LSSATIVVRKARINRGRKVNIFANCLPQFPENIENGDNSFINHQYSVWAATGRKVGIEQECAVRTRLFSHRCQSWKRRRPAPSASNRLKMPRYD
jgi:hypothetical protein